MIWIRKSCFTFSDGHNLLFQPSYVWTIPWQSHQLSARLQIPQFLCFVLREPLTWRDKGPLSKCLSNVNSGWLGWLSTPGLLSFFKWQCFGKKHMNLPSKTFLNPSNQTKKHSENRPVQSVPRPAPAQAFILSASHQLSRSCKDQDWMGRKS